MYKLDKYWHGLVHILFPQRCAGCDRVLLYQEQVLCSTCLYHLPKTNHHLDPENETAKQLWGKVPFRRAASMLKLSKSSRVQEMVHQLKYGQQPGIGIYLGEMYGKILQDNPMIEGVDLIVPVPIHPFKKKKRGYNQSEYFARGLSEVLKIPYDSDVLKRTVDSVSQTRKSRAERYDNVEGVFSFVSQPPDRHLTHVLLVDDVITTGATISAAAQQLIDGMGCEVSILTIARA